MFKTGANRGVLEGICIFGLKFAEHKVSHQRQGGLRLVGVAAQFIGCSTIDCYQVLASCSTRVTLRATQGISMPVYTLVHIYLLPLHYHHEVALLSSRSVLVGA